jgi:DNA replication protein
MLEKEIGKQLSPIEIEIVKAWKEVNYSDEIIKEAIKEAVMNGVTTLRYIDKILSSWAKKGIKTKEDVEQNKKNFVKEKEEKEKRERNKIPNFYDDDGWLDEDE